MGKLSETVEDTETTNYSINYLILPCIETGDVSFHFYNFGSIPGGLENIVNFIHFWDRKCASAIFGNLYHSGEEIFVFSRYNHLFDFMDHSLKN